MTWFESQRGRILTMMLKSSEKDSLEKSKKEITNAIELLEDTRTDKQKRLNYGKKMNIPPTTYENWELLPRQKNFISTTTEQMGNKFVKNYLEPIKIRFDMDRAIYTEDTPFVDRIVEEDTKEAKESIYKEYSDRFGKDRLNKLKKG